MCSNYLGIKWNQRFRDNKTKLKICHHMVTSSSQLQNKAISRHRKDENVCRMSKKEKCTCKACKSIFFHCQICKFMTFLLPLLSWLRKRPIVLRGRRQGSEIFQSLTKSSENTPDTFVKPSGSLVPLLFPISIESIVI